MRTLVKNVVIVNDFAYVQGGASKVAIDTANILADRGYRVFFFTGEKDSRTSNTLSKKITIISTEQGEALLDKNKLRGVRNGIYNRKARKELTKLLGELNPNETVVHVHGWTKCLSSSIFMAAFEKKFRLVLTLHDYFVACPNGGFFNYKKNRICHLCPMSGACIRTDCDSRNYVFKIYRLIRQFVQNKIVKLPSRLENVIYISDLQWSVLKDSFRNLKKSEKIANPIDISPTLAKKKVNGKYYLYVGRLSPEKGIVNFCEAFSEMDYPTIVVGDGPLMNELRRKYKNIRFVGWKTENEVIEYMLKAKALVFPSIWYEGQPLVPIKAESLGLPCILSDKSSACEFTDNKDFVYDGDSKDSLKGVIERFELCYNSIKILPKKRQDYGKEIVAYYDGLLK